MTAALAQPPLKLIKLLACFVLAVVLVWLIVTTSLTAYLARSAPTAALELHPTASSALMTLAINALDRALAVEPAGAAGGTASIAPPVKHGGEPTSEQIWLWARTALIQDPLNARAMRILGQLAAQASKHPESARFMRAAARRSLRETVAVYMLMRDSYAKKDHAKTLFYANAILRTNPRASVFVVPTLARMAESDGANDLLLALLARNPPWRARFFSQLTKSITDARTPLFLLLNLEKTEHPATTAELRSYLDFLIAGHFFEVAYYTWLQFLPSDQLRNVGLLFNGSFESQPSRLPFDWRIAQGSGVTIDIAPRPDQKGQKALLIEFGHGRVQFGQVSQLTLLAPGTYRLEGKYRGKIIGRRGLIWRISCLGERSNLIGESAMIVGIASAWKIFGSAFTVPAGCQAQRIRLIFDARSASERLVIGKVWFDELRLLRQ